MALYLALVSQVNEIAHSRAARVHAVRVALGPLAGIEPRLLAPAYVPEPAEATRDV
jgi:Zn finger protein HypA/HybF involved in hydrogenase expression